MLKLLAGALEAREQSAAEVVGELGSVVGPGCLDEVEGVPADTQREPQHGRQHCELRHRADEARLLRVVRPRPAVKVREARGETDAVSVLYEGVAQLVRELRWA